ncbi:transcription factor SRM1-like [Phalaenopsis equestris]|uniref:transcription factor SRM1-like n=1 Tax=Phalaenopsis equestris TaxID=78828 RepID=UPI0009E2CB63|nr:transcription factor SRM1-like [Phalaenopsis equestris]
MMSGGYLQFTASDQIPADPATWTTEENKTFERALVDVPEEAPDRWWRIAAQIPGKAPEDIYLHYLLLIHDIGLIDSGGVDLPPYEIETGDLSPETAATADLPMKEGRRKGVPWSEDEHRRFLEGLERFGRGDWRNISRWSVKTRTPTQVASHAQKYYLRQSVKKESKRKSIHDITT